MTVSDKIHSFVGGGDSAIQVQLNNLYSQNNWIANPDKQENIFLYLTNRDNAIIAAVRINTESCEFDGDIIRSEYQHTNNMMRLLSKRVEYIRQAYMQTPFYLYTEDQHMHVHHINSGLYSVSCNPIPKGQNTYFAYTTFMTDEHIQTRLKEEKILSAIVHIRQCVGTYISDDYILSAFHCSQHRYGKINIEANNPFMSIKGDDISEEYLFHRACGDQLANYDALFSDFSIYKMQKRQQGNTIIKPYWWVHDVTKHVFDENIRLVVYNQSETNLLAVSTFKIGSTHNNDCAVITITDLNVQRVDTLNPNSGGPLLAYLGDKFYLIGVRSAVDYKATYYSPICNIKEDNAVYGAVGEAQIFEIKDNKYIYKEECKIEGDDRKALMSLIRPDPAQQSHL